MGGCWLNVALCMLNPTLFAPLIDTRARQVTESGDEAIVQQLLDGNASVDVTTAASDPKAPSRSPLWIAARAQNTNLVKLLLSANANPNIPSGVRDSSTIVVSDACVHE